MSALASNRCDGLLAKSKTPDLGLWKLILLTICLAGVQFTWTVELAYGTPYLLSLGLAKSLTALVWIAGPLSGILIQPIVGVYSDRSTFQYGRRRPFILIGGLLVVISIAMIAYSREFSDVLMGWNKTAKDDQLHLVTIIVAVVGFYFLDFSINAVQASCRALIVDVSPLHQQDLANAWGGRMIGLGNVLGYFVGYLDLPKLFPMLGPTQLKILCVIAITWFVTTILVTCIAIVERPYKQRQSERHQAWWKPLMEIFHSLSTLPRSIQSVCNVQFLAWLGWFPFLFYSTSWISDRLRYGKYSLTRIMDTNDTSDEGTRAGSFSLLLFAIISVITGFILPMMVKHTRTSGRNGRFDSPRSQVDVSYRQTWAEFFTLPRIWSMSLFGFAILMVLTAAVHEVIGATFIIAATGISWGVAQWVPFTLMGEFVSFYSDGNPESRCNQSDDTERALPNLSASSAEREIIISRSDSQPTRRDGYAVVQDEDEIVNYHASSSQPPPCVADIGNSNESGLQAGMVLGIHNIYIVLPQFLSTVMSAIVFAIISELQKSSPIETPAEAFDAFGWTLRLGAFASIGAAIIALKIKPIQYRSCID
ncbi:hypothetical protein QVD99_005628 [Batrachochytrium dendrobatidis]|nr:hypothetical protein QVD99_005628 [Batrachochytrium dendrobatidis]